MNTMQPSSRVHNEATAWTLVFVSWMVASVSTLGALFFGEVMHLVRFHSPTLGNADASVVIVEFLDPACETCRAFYPLVKRMMAANPDRIRLVLRYAPFHNGSEKVVAVLEAARKQGKFWPALEPLLAARSSYTAWVNYGQRVTAIARGR